jgi:hypothetical protein
MRRACVLVDGENFRHSLKHLFPSGRYSFGKATIYPRRTGTPSLLRSPIASIADCSGRTGMLWSILIVGHTRFRTSGMPRRGFLLDGTVTGLMLVQPNQIATNF